jgi:endonuclease/exonuclease/phosphatase family metal-dependent hydrolase
MHKFPLLLAGIGLLGCPSSEPSDTDASDVVVERNAAPECNPIVERTSANPGDLTGLAPLPGQPLPRLGPNAQGFFHPASPYTEGGTFASPADKPEWAVAAADIAPRAPAGALRVIEWNVERGIQLDKSIRLMKKLNADVWLLNETDLYGKNARGVVVAREIARALGYSYYTGVEFLELRDDRRGTSGNAIVSRLPLTNVRSIAIPMLTSEGGHDWSLDAGEKRCGMRNALGAAIAVKTATGETRAIDLVALHTENKSNKRVRRKQMDFVKDQLVTPRTPTIFAGDLNTVTAGEGPELREDLKRLNAEQGRDKTLFDCSLGDDATTFSAAGFIRLRIDWMLVQSGAGSVLDCPAQEPRRYKVEGNDGASDHKPVRTDFVVR